MCIKFIVLIFCFKEVVLHQLKYCDICANHTLCKYKNPGPSNTCVGYDKNALLTKRNVEDVIERINNRRNFIALGNLKYLPGAANMKKVEWSPELATMAQTWADQCDSSTLPDKQDQCRDTEYFKVGQNIATISGLAPGVNVKSFIDMWFIESLDYTGSVSYYNQSRDNKTNYFTQLIWAETDKVGCGKVRFYITEPRYMLLERLVCNFAPKGNIHGKPIYTIGYPSTQCAAQLTPDSVYSGLCSYKGPDKVERKAQHMELNLQDLYFRRIRLPNSKSNSCGVNDTQCKKDKQSQNMQNMKKSIVSVKRSQSDDQWPDPNTSKDIERQYHEKGHSRVHNNHNHKVDFDSIHPSTKQGLRKYDALISSAVPLLVEDYRRQNINKKCTRRYGAECNDKVSTQCTLCCEASNRCTRGQMKLCSSTTFPTLGNLCPCQTQKIQCSPPSYQNICGSNLHKALVVSGSNHNKNIMKRNNITANISKGFHSKVDYEDYLSHDRDQDETMLSNMYTKNHVTSINVDSFEPNYSERLRRENEDAHTAKPFWQMDSFLTQDQLQLKGLRYTTITNRNHKNRKHSKISRTLETPSTTEFITIAKYLSGKEKSLTEKYLSFDELLHLRKFNTDNYNFRRQGSNNAKAKTTVTTTVATTESVYTANTPFVRMKHCTRRLTCTWTANLLTDSDGNAVVGNGSVGQNTPPGYVEGCTRTSTCTRDYMQRNIMPSTISDFTPSEEKITNGEYEDYCERRSLNKRDLLKKVFSKEIYGRKLKTDFSPPEPYKQTTIITKYNYKESNIADYIPSHRYPRKEKNDKNIISYGDLYYFVVQKLIESWQKKRKFPNKKCACSNSNTNKYGINLFLFVSAWYLHGHQFV